MIAGLRITPMAVQETEGLIDDTNQFPQEDLNLLLDVFFELVKECAPPVSLSNSQSGQSPQKISSPVADSAVI